MTTLSDTHKNTIGSGFYNAQFTDEGIGAQRGQIILPMYITSWCSDTNSNPESPVTTAHTSLYPAACQLNK